MISKTCCTNLGIIGQGLKQNKFIILLFTIAMFLTSSLPFVLQYQNVLNNLAEDPDAYYNISPYIGILEKANAFEIIVFVIMAFIAGVAMFSYLFNKSATIFYHKIPSNRTNLFACRYVVGLLMLVIPIVLIFGVNSILFFVFNIGQYDSYIYMVHWLCTTMIFSVYIYSTSVLATVITSNIFTQIIVMLFIHFAVLVATIIGATFMDTYIATFDLTTWMDYYLNFDKNIFLLPNLYERIQPLGNIVYYLCYSGVMSIAALIFYKKRKSEDVSKMIAFPLIKKVIKYYICAFAGLGFVVLIALLFGSGAGMTNIIFTYFYLIIGSGLVYVIIDAIFEKNIKSILNNKIELITFMGIFLIVASTIIFDVTSFNTRVPERSKISMVKIDGYDKYQNNGDIIIKDQSIIDDIYKFTSQMAKATKEVSASVNYRDYQNEQQVFTIVAKVKGGFDFIREYTVDTKELGLLIETLVSNEEYINILYKGLSTFEVSSASVVKDISNSIEKGRAQELRNAYMEDVNNGKLMEAYEQRIPFEANISFYQGYLNYKEIYWDDNNVNASKELLIYKNFDKTLKFLNDKYPKMLDMTDYNATVEKIMIGKIDAKNLNTDSIRQLPYIYEKHGDKEMAEVEGDTTTPETKVLDIAAGNVPEEVQSALREEQTITNKEDIAALTKYYVSSQPNMKGPFYYCKVYKGKNNKENTKIFFIPQNTAPELLKNLFK